MHDWLKTSASRPICLWVIFAAILEVLPVCRASAAEDAILPAPPAADVVAVPQPEGLQSIILTQSARPLERDDSTANERCLLARAGPSESPQGPLYADIVSPCALPERRDAGSRVPEPREPYRLRTFLRQSSSVKWELVALGTMITATRFKDFTTGGSGFHFKHEGWFGRDTSSLGMDKLHHAWKTYVFADILQTIIQRRAGNHRNAAFTSTALSLTVMTYAEVLDGFTGRTGFSNEDMIAHAAGAALSLTRNFVPGLRGKVDFRMEINPASLGDDLRLIDQLAERRYLLAWQLAGFRRFENSPLRFVEVHLGYYGRGFTDTARARGDPLRRRLYVGLGFNLQQLFPLQPRSRLVRMARGSLDYLQAPYTSVRFEH